MMGLEARKKIMDESKKRIQAMQFDDPVTNVCAGDNNPMRHAYFVEYKIKSYKNKAGLIHREYLARVCYGDKKNKFANVGIEVIYPGHLDYEKCKELFQPVWEAHYQ